MNPDSEHVDSSIGGKGGALSKAVIADYGACVNPDELGHLIPEEHLSSLALLINGWSTLLPLLGPVCVIITLNYLNPDELAMECEMNHSIGVKMACAATIPAVRSFPRLAILLGLLLLAWRIAHERAYYILMSNRIMLDFQIGKRFGHWATITLVSLFSISLLHFMLKFFAGHPCPGGHDHCQADKYMLSSTLAELISNPNLLNDERNKYAKDFLNDVFLTFVMPSLVCLMTLNGLLNLESELMPLSKMLESHPRKAYRQLGCYAYVPEPVLRKLVARGVEAWHDDAACTIEDLCRELYEASKAEGCVVLGMPDNDTTLKEQFVEARKAETSDLTLSAGLAEVLNLYWWPVKLLLDINLTGEASINFQRFMGLHFAATLLAIIFMEVLASMRLLEYTRLLFTDPAHNHTALVPIAMLGTELYVEFTWMYQAQKLAMGIFANSKDVEQV